VSGCFPLDPVYRGHPQAALLDFAKQQGKGLAIFYNRTLWSRHSTTSGSLLPSGENSLFAHRDLPADVLRGAPLQTRRLGGTSSDPSSRDLSVRAVTLYGAFPFT
jgi:hypothetical protein